MSTKQSKLSSFRHLRYEFPEIDGESKLRELILYIADQCIDDPYFGATKLNKILYFSDFEAFRRYGKPITGVEYQRLERGPAPRKLLPIRDEMERQDDIVIKPVPTMMGKQYRVIALREPNLDIFSAREISIVDSVIAVLRDRTATETSHATHGIAWHVYDNYDLIPYESVHISDEITGDDIKRAHELIEEHGWDDV